MTLEALLNQYMLVLLLLSFGTLAACFVVFFRAPEVALASAFTAIGAFIVLATWGKGLVFEAWLRVVDADIARTAKQPDLDLPQGIIGLALAGTFALVSMLMRR